jgi:glucose-1-phosphate thymidylyltransferase
VAAGVQRAVLVVAANDSSIQDYLQGHFVPGIAVDYAVQEKPKGLADATLCARDKVGEEPFLLFLGDELLEGGVTKFVENASVAEAEACVLVKPVPDPIHFGVAVMEGERIVQAVEKPDEPLSPYAIVGVYAFTPKIFEAIAATPISRIRNETEITDAIQRLIDTGHYVRGVVHERAWFDIGRFETLLDANRFYLEREVTDVPSSVGEHCRVVGRAVVSRSSTLVNCAIQGPCIIGAGCVMRDSTIGPYASIGENCLIQGSRVENSVVGNGCEITQAPGGIFESVMGDGAKVDGGGTNQVMRLRVADHTTIEVGRSQEQ